MLTAFEEVEDNLSTLRILTVELEQQNAAVESSRRFLTLASDRYQSGMDGYLDVVTAQIALLTNRRAVMDLRMLQITTGVRLIKSMGGGWDGTSALDR